MKMLLGLLLLAPLLSIAAGSSDTLQVAPSSARWDLQGNAKATVYRGRPCLQLDGGAALLKDFELTDGVVDVDVATPATRGFFGIQFRLDNEGANGEFVYRSQERAAKGSAGAVRADGNDLLCELHGPHHTRCHLGAATPADARGHADELGALSCVRRTRAPSGAAAVAR
jgi:hypothetical protein